MEKTGYFTNKGGLLRLGEVVAETIKAADEVYAASLQDAEELRGSAAFEKAVAAAEETRTAQIHAIRDAFGFQANQACERIRQLADTLKPSAPTEEAARAVSMLQNCEHPSAGMIQLAADVARDALSSEIIRGIAAREGIAYVQRMPDTLSSDAVRRAADDAAAIFRNALDSAQSPIGHAGDGAGTYAETVIADTMQRKAQRDLLRIKSVFDFGSDMLNSQFDELDGETYFFKFAY